MEAEICLRLAILDHLQQRGHIFAPNFNNRCATVRLHPASNSYSGHGIGAAKSANVAGILNTTIRWLGRWESLPHQQLKPENITSVARSLYLFNIQFLALRTFLLFAPLNTMYMSQHTYNIHNLYYFTITLLIWRDLIHVWAMSPRQICYK